MGVAGAAFFVLIRWMYYSLIYTMGDHALSYAGTTHPEGGNENASKKAFKVKIG